MDIGIGLWGMQSTRSAPVAHATLYRRLAEDSQVAEDLGYESLWLTEHRFWYDGYLPSLLAAGGYMAGATTRLRIGTGCLLLPQHDPIRVAQGVAALDQVSNGRLDFGVALGYRDEEFDGLGIHRKERAQRMEYALDVLAAAGAGRPIHYGGPVITPRPVQDPVPIWVAAVSDAAVKRAARRGLDILLSDAHDDQRAGELVELYKKTADEHGVDSTNVRFGILRYVWVDDSAARAEAEVVPRLRSFLLEQLGGWRYLSDENGNALGFEQPEKLRMAAEGVIRNNAAIGTPDTVIRKLRALESVGVNFVVARSHLVSQTPQQLHHAMELLAREVAPAVATTRKA
ncbi:LLM class flavin-dependent oxidoreductase [Microcella alkalica]|uniref:Alkanesulfonate monooxygenase SsuD/methylene tetrahydromethanopterin reductase-like flavin-dependent oxidoreductase (Luciferase family) n=1 Tax=Microcella alkalica TaxID=355930 RepID=A0A839E6B8_9MICO|nr:LLM class flavin-dependent oxidoreductase [Microcella alkalica]MBA8847340.1 alkanesulfonate monooxygenase SsuD/methylene tetrahydromethanopterin reductase-like flavin-dependent oxidoreductase (luciferase family) [Microcella alkalica]